MKGSEKQIKWAEDIKQEITSSWGLANITPPGQKAIDFISGIDDARFWIDNKSNNGLALLQSLAAGHLRVKGSGYSNVAKITPDGIITETWDEIVSDGKGGHKETRTKQH